MAFWRSAHKNPPIFAIKAVGIVRAFLNRQADGPVKLRCRSVSEITGQKVEDEAFPGSSALKNIECRPRHAVNQ